MTKKLLFSILLAGAIFTLNAQDIIIKENGEEIKAKVTEVGTNEIKYKKHGNESGPTYTISKSEVFLVKYANGTKEVIEQQVAPAPAPVTPQTTVTRTETTSTIVQTGGKKEKNESNTERKSNYFVLGFAPGSITKPKEPEGSFYKFNIGWTHQYTDLFGWDIFSLHAGTVSYKEEAMNELVKGFNLQLMTGPRFYVPSLSDEQYAIFGAFNAGVASHTESIDNIGFCFDLECGIRWKFLYSALYYDQTNVKVDTDYAEGTSKTKIFGIRVGFHF